MSKPKLHYIFRAFQRTINLVSFGIGLLFSLILSSGGLLAVVLAAEFVYLGVKSSSKKFRQELMIKEGFGGGRFSVSERDQKVDGLNGEMVQIYQDFRRIYRQIQKIVIERNLFENILVVSAVKNLETVSDDLLMMLLAIQDVDQLFLRTDEKSLREEKERLSNLSAPDSVEADISKASLSMIEERLKALEDAKNRRKILLSKVEMAKQAAKLLADRFSTWTGPVESMPDVEAALLNLADAQNLVSSQSKYDSEFYGVTQNRTDSSQKG